MQVYSTGTFLKLMCSSIHIAVVARSALLPEDVEKKVCEFGESFLRVLHIILWMF